MKKYLLLLMLIPLIAVAFELPESPDDVKIDSILLEYHNGVLTNCVVRGNLTKAGVSVKSGKKDITAQLPSAHKTQYETYLGIYEANLKTQLGL